MGREMLPGVIDTINSISLSIVVGGLLGIVGFIFITFLYSEKRDLGIVGWLFTTFRYSEKRDPEFFPIKEEPISKHEEQNGGH
jgi:hypothetical protein